MTTRHGAAFAELTPVTFLRRGAAVFAERLAVVDGGIVGRERHTAGRPGMRAGPEHRILLEAHFGVPLAGAVIVTLNTRLSAGEIAYIIGHSGARLVGRPSRCDFAEPVRAGVRRRFASVARAVGPTARTEFRRATCLWADGDVRARCAVRVVTRMG